MRTTKPHIRTDERAFSECENVDADNVDVDVDVDNVDLHYPLPLCSCGGLAVMTAFRV